MSAAAPSLLQEGRNCWQLETAERAAIIIDADRYFAAARAAMLKARRRIFMIGWDFDARVDLDRTAEEVNGPRDLGSLLPWLTARTPGLEIYLLRWDTGTLKAVVKRGTIRASLRWVMSERINIRLDGHHPVTASHHQKILVIDDRLAFCGGIDMLSDRWDTREHREGDPRRSVGGGKPFKPWHDATAVLTGPSATRLAELTRERWRRSGGETLGPVDGLPDAAPDDCWLPGVPVGFRDVPVAISRTLPRMDDQRPAHEIERLTLDLIAAARRHIYAESQYFASRLVARAIARRLEEPDGPEVVIVNPVSAQGIVEPVAMDTTRARLVQALRSCRGGERFRIYHALNGAGTPIYCHAKVLVVDDVLLKIGSSNLNNRSMRLDTECDLTFDARCDPGHRGAIRALRDGLIAEHLGLPARVVGQRIGETSSLVAAIEALRLDEGTRLRPYEVPDLNAVERWLADNEVLDPEGPDELFEPPERHGLFRARTGLLNRLMRR